MIAIGGPIAGVNLQTNGSMYAYLGPSQGERHVYHRIMVRPPVGDTPPGSVYVHESLTATDKGGNRHAAHHLVMDELIREYRP